jgi:hypothetical protein
MAPAPLTPMINVRNNPMNIPKKVYWHIPLAHYTIEDNHHREARP